MNPDSGSSKGTYSSEYLQQVYKNLLKKGNNISLAELNTAPTTVAEPAASQSSMLSVSMADQSQIRQTVKIIQSNGAQIAEQHAAAGHKQVAPSTSQGTVSLLNTPTSRGDGCIMGYKRRQQTNKRRPQGAIQDPYYHKWKHLKKYIKNMVFMNAAVCDQVVREEEKVAKAREERRFLLRKLLHYQTVSESQPLSLKQFPPSLLKSAGEELLTGIKTKKKVLASPASSKKKAGKELIESLPMKSKPKKSRVSGGKHIVPPIPLDSIGRPIFPLNIGELTLHSVGEIVPDRPGFHTSNSIFPVGYCSTRVYANLQNPERPSLYTCKISDGGKGPMFEIVPEDNSEVFRSRFLSECHSQLLRSLSQYRGAKLVDTVGKGPEFFGLSHPVVQNLIQSCPGAKKCNGYKWVKFEVNKGLTIDKLASPSEDPSISHQALRLKLFGAGMEMSQSNLRSLLTSAALDAGGKPAT